MTDTTDNPLLAPPDPIPFDRIAAEHVVPAIDAAIREADRAIEALEDPAGPATWSAFVEPLNAATERVAQVWSIVSHLNAVADTPDFRRAHNESLPKVTEFWTRLGQNLALFAQYRAIADAPDFATLVPAKRRVVENALRDFRLSGAELPPAEKQRYAAIEDELAQLGQRFAEHVLDATNEGVIDVPDASALAGMADDAIEAARARAAQAGVAGYRLTLHLPMYLAVMQFAKDRALRERLYAAYVKRASEFGRPEQDNGPLIERILELRAESAALMHYPDYASLAMVPKMADTPDDVLAFLEKLRARAKPFGERDLGELTAFAQAELGIDHLAAWDLLYASERLREHRYAFSQQEVKNYFRESTVLDGLFRVVGRLFSVAIREQTGPGKPPVWHPDVRFFEIVDPRGARVAQFYLDLYARTGKRSGAWMASARNRVVRESVTTPIAYLTCNFSEPLRDAEGRAVREALFTHMEVNTLFHEFGHGLHHMLTRVDEAPVAGIRGVEWDAVELPSQFLENFCWEWEVVEHMTSHIDTGQPIPRALFDRMLAAKNFQAGIQMLRQLELGIFDMRLHARFDVHGDKTVMDLLDEVRRDVAVLELPAYNRQPHQFSHIFAGAYAAGYYSYKWAEVLSADAYARFEEDGVLNAETGGRFLDEILGVGGSRPALESFVSFRGREPELDALLRHNGMVEEAEAEAP